MCFGTLEVPGYLLDTFKFDTLIAAKECIGEFPTSRVVYLPRRSAWGILRRITVPGLMGIWANIRLCRVGLDMRNDDRYARGLADEVEGSLDTNDHRLVRHGWAKGSLGCVLTAVVRGGLFKWVASSC